MKKRLLLFLMMAIAVASCSDADDVQSITDNFDRQSLLENWADNVIIPSYTTYLTRLNELKYANDAFQVARSSETLATLREKYLSAAKAWQWVSLFEIGKAEELTLRDYSNIYPTSTLKIEDAIQTGSYNLELATSRDQQGLPAIDYLINGIGADDTEIIEKYSTNAEYEVYLNNLINRLISLTTLVNNDWQNGYREAFIADDGSAASSSVNKLINDFMFYYEKALRAGKVGIPSGVYSIEPLPNRIESYYRAEHSKILLNEALTATKGFFNGISVIDESNNVGLDDYLDYVNAISGGENLSALINHQFENSQVAIDILQDNLATQIQTDNSQMLAVFDELQKNVILMKVDMLQALNIKVDFVDADGD